MMLELFSTRKVKEFAKKLVQDLAKRYPPAIANNPAQVVSPQRLSVILEEIYFRAAEFKRNNRLGWYTEARLRNEFRRELEEMGYEEKFIADIAKGLTAS